MQDLIEINLKRYNPYYQLHPDGIVSLDLDFKMLFGKLAICVVVTELRRTVWSVLMDIPKIRLCC